MAKRDEVREAGVRLIGTIDNVEKYLREHGHELGPKNRKQRKTAFKMMKEIKKKARRKMIAAREVERPT